MDSRSVLFCDPESSTKLNKVKQKGDINLNQGVSIAFFLYTTRAPPIKAFSKQITKEKVYYEYFKTIFR